MTDGDDKQVDRLFPDYASYLFPPFTLGEKHVVGPHGKGQEEIPV